MKFTVFVISTLVLFTTFQDVKCDDVQYFINLIQQEVRNARRFKTPKSASEYKPKSTEVHPYDTYDYIVIGAGSTGAVVASRLSEDPGSSVLLLEAGGPESNFTDIPSYSYYLVNSPYNWEFRTTPQKNACLGMRNRQCEYPRGKGIGGSSITNSLNYVRGNRKDFDLWATLGNPGWSYKDVLPYFKKSEDARFANNPYYHGSGGYLKVEYENPNGRQYQAYIEANLEKGRYVIDYNAEKMLGVGKTQFNTINGRRDSTAKAFLKPAENRPNLKILPFSYVTKINIRPDTKEAYGVTFSHKNKLYLANINREIILSAGTFQSPQILMLSGIGLSGDLVTHGITPIESLAVGHNLQDHNGYLGLIFECNATVPPQNLRDYVQEYLQSFGPLPFAVNSKALSWFQTKMEHTPDWPDVEVIMVTSNNTGEILQRFNNYNDETYNSIFRGIDPTRSFTTSLLLMRPKSRGQVRLASSDPYAFPLIDPNFYSDPFDHDLKSMYEGIQIILDLINTQAFQHINASLRFAPHPRCRNLKYLSREYWYCQLKTLTLPFYHPVGTCMMGPNPYNGAVVNHRLQVHGIANLRVADCSIMPTEITGHTNAPAIMIGEKAADMIKEDQRLDSDTNSMDSEPEMSDTDADTDIDDGSDSDDGGFGFNDEVFDPEEEIDPNFL